MYLSVAFCALFCVLAVEARAPAQVTSPKTFAKGVLLENCWGLQLILQNDCNLVIQNKHTLAVLWNSETAEQSCSELAFQNNGRLILRDGATSSWTSVATGSDGPYRLSLQTDSNLVIYSSSNAVLWQTDTDTTNVACPATPLPTPLPTPPPTPLLTPMPTPNGFKAPAQLQSPQTFTKGVLLENCWGLQLILQTDCNLVIQNKHTLAVVWNAESKGICTHLLFQEDGHLVLRNGMSIVWTSNAHGSEKPYRLSLQTDSNLVVYSNNNAVLWQSDTDTTVVPCPTPRASAQDAANRLQNQLRRAMPLEVDPFRSFKRARLQETDRVITVFDTKFLNVFSNNAERHKNYEETLALAAVAGIVNRHYPQLFLVRQDIDEHWLEESKNWMPNAKFEVFSGTDTVALIQHVFATHNSGVPLEVILYGTSAATQASSMVAATAAGCQNVIPVAKRPGGDGLYHRLVISGPQLKVHTDLTTTSCTSKISCYQYALDTYGDQVSTDTAAYYLDYFWVLFRNSNDPTQHTAMNADYFISKKAFFFDLNSWDDEAPNDSPNQPIDADVNMLKSIFSRLIQRQGANKKFIHVGGFTPWFYKYTSKNGHSSNDHEPVPSEWRYAYILSQYNAFMDADAFGLNAMNNAAFYHHYELPTRLVSRNVPGRLYEPNLEAGKVKPKRYYAFLVCDYDSAAWVNSQLLSRWNHAQRGNLPLTWVVNPAITKRAPMMIHEMYKTVAATDVITAEEGMGYLNPHGVFRIPGQPISRQSGIPDADELFASEQEHYYSRLSQTFSSFIINGDYGQPINQRASHMFAQAGWDGMIVNGGGAYTEPYLTLGAPVIAGRSLHASREGVTVEDSLNLNRDQFLQWFSAPNNAAPSKPKFIGFRSVLTDPGYWVRLKAKIERVDPHAVLVDAVSLGYLARNYLGGNQGTRVSYMSDSLEQIDFLMPGTQSVTLEYRNDAVGQVYSRDNAILLIQTRDSSGNILYTGGFELSEDAPRGHIKSASGSFPVPSGRVGQRIIVHMELAWRNSIAFSTHGNPARIYSFQVLASAPSCPAVYCPVGGLNLNAARTTRPQAPLAETAIRTASPTPMPTPAQPAQPARPAQPAQPETTAPPTTMADVNVDPIDGSSITDAAVTAAAAVSLSCVLVGITLAAQI